MELGEATGAVPYHTIIQIPVNNSFHETNLLSLSFDTKSMEKAVEPQVFGIKEVFCPPAGVNPELE